MATPTTNGKDTEPKKGRTKKGEGPYTLSFIDADNKEHSRVPSSVNALKVADKSGKSKTYAITSMGPAVMQQLAAEGLRRRLDAFMRNSVGGEKTPIVLADEMYANIKSGKIYIKGESKGAGRTFDFDLWILAIERLAKIKNSMNPKSKPATKSQLDSLRTKLTSATPKERSDMIAKWKKDPSFIVAKKQVDAERASKVEIKESEYDALTDAF